jgi:prefoldin subunit 5
MTDKPTNPDVPNPNDDSNEPDLYVNDILKQHPQVHLDHILARLHYIADQSQRPEQLLEALQVLNTELQTFRSNYEAIQVLVDRVQQFYEGVTEIQEAQVREFEKFRPYVRRQIFISGLIIGVLASISVSLTHRFWVAPQTMMYLERIDQRTSQILEGLRKIQRKLGIPII